MHRRYIYTWVVSYAVSLGQVQIKEIRPTTVLGAAFKALMQRRRSILMNGRTLLGGAWILRRLVVCMRADVVRRADK